MRNWPYPKHDPIFRRQMITDRDDLEVRSVRSNRYCRHQSPLNKPNRTPRQHPHHPTRHKAVSRKRGKTPQTNDQFIGREPAICKGGATVTQQYGSLPSPKRDSIGRRLTSARSLMQSTGVDRKMTLLSVKCRRRYRYRRRRLNAGAQNEKKTKTIASAVVVG